VPVDNFELVEPLTISCLDEFAAVQLTGFKLYMTMFPQLCLPQPHTFTALRVNNQQHPNTGCTSVQQQQQQQQPAFTSSYCCPCLGIA
jgi:hypothetical protein